MHAYLAHVETAAILGAGLDMAACAGWSNREKHRRATQRSYGRIMARGCEYSPHFVQEKRCILCGSFLSFLCLKLCVCVCVRVGVADDDDALALTHPEHCLTMRTVTCCVLLRGCMRRRGQTTTI